MQKRLNARRIVTLLFLVAVFASGASFLFAQTTIVLSPKDFESNSLLFVQQDVLPSFGPTGVRLGTAKGMINGNITTNFSFTVPPPNPPTGKFVADDLALLIDTDGDQILFKVHSEGTASFDTLDGFINPFRAPFLSTYTVDQATGKLSKYKDLVFPARGTAVLSNQVIGTPVGTVFVEVSRNALHK